MHQIEAVVALILIAYLLFHHRHYRRHRRAGLTIRQSIPGPWGTWFTIGKRFRD